VLSEKSLAVEAVPAVAAVAADWAAVDLAAEEKAVAAAVLVKVAVVEATDSEVAAMEVVDWVAVVMGLVVEEEAASCAQHRRTKTRYRSGTLQCDCIERLIQSCYTEYRFGHRAFAT